MATKVIVNPGRQLEVGEKKGDKYVSTKYGPGDEATLEDALAKKAIDQGAARLPKEPEPKAETGEQVTKKK